MIIVLSHFIAVINSYRFCTGEGKGDLLQWRKPTIAVPSTARFKQTIEIFLFAVIHEIPS